MNSVSKEGLEEETRNAASVGGGLEPGICRQAKQLAFDGSNKDGEM